jgi:hypothetical protein
MCDAVSIDEVLLGQRVDFVKVDVEGAELAVLDGMSGTIADNPHIELMVEYSPANLRSAGVDPDLLLKRLGDHGFYVYTLSEGSKGILVLPFGSSSPLHGRRGTYLFCTREEVG